MTALGVRQWLGIARCLPWSPCGSNSVSNPLAGGGPLLPTNLRLFMTIVVSVRNAHRAQETKIRTWSKASSSRRRPDARVAPRCAAHVQRVSHGSCDARRH